MGDWANGRDGTRWHEGDVETRHALSPIGRGYIINIVRMTKKQTEPKEEYSRLVVDDVVYNTRTNRMYDNRRPYVPDNPKMVTSFMPGNIQDVFVSVGDEVHEGTRLCILEAMKMKNVIISPVSGIVKAINVNTGDKVAKNQILVELE